MIGNSRRRQRYHCLRLVGIIWVKLSSSLHVEKPVIRYDRRQLLLAGGTTAAAIVSLGDGTRAAATDGPILTLNSLLAASSSLPTGLLNRRVTENVLSPPPYGLETADVTYPAWFAGSWHVRSQCTKVQTPCGMALFGGNATYAKAQAEVRDGRPLKYMARFIVPARPNDENGAVIADREYNVQSIAQASMGANSVVHVNMATPNQFSCVLAPPGSPNLLQVDLITLARRQEDGHDNHFDCAEVCREIVAPLDSNTGRRQTNMPLPLVLKEIETVSLYTRRADDRIACQQRSATFLLPSQQSAVATQMWQASQGRPVDVRLYDVLYTKK